MDDALFFSLAGLPELVDGGQVVQQTVPLEPAVPAADRAVVSGVRLEGVGAVAHFQPGLQLLQHLAHLPLGGVEHLRQQEPLRLRRPGIKHPGGQVGQFLHAEGKQGLGRLLIHLHRAGWHLLKQAGKLLRAAL